MIARGTPDIGWSDLLFALIACIQPPDNERAQAAAERAFSPGGDALACLSVRSGFDLVLQALALAPGNEVLVSAVTIPDMVRIIEHHGLVAVPFELDMETLEVDRASLERAVSRRTRAILVAHLFGGLVPLDPLVALAQRLDVPLLEDCAQAYMGPGYRGHSASSVSMFSFGPIKTSTALAGALLRFRDPALLAQVRTLQEAYPRQSRQEYAMRVVRFLLLKLLANPALFRIFVVICQALGTSHDRLINSAVRGFAQGELIERIRRKPAAPLLALLARRLQRDDGAALARRIAQAERLYSHLPPLVRPGAQAVRHAHWIVPVVVSRPDEVVRLLWHYGFDATRSASSLSTVPPPLERPETAPVRVGAIMQQVIYLPRHPELGERDMIVMGRLLAEVEAGGWQTRQPSPGRPRSLRSEP